MKFHTGNESETTDTADLTERGGDFCGGYAKSRSDKADERAQRVNINLQNRSVNW